MLRPFFKPEGVAVIGASRNPHKLGYGVVRNLKDYRYQGGIYPVNKSATEILDLPCYESVAEVPDPVDLAVIIVPAPVVPEIIKQCGQRGIKHTIVISGGFSETGEEGQKLEEELKRVANEWEVNFIGPNCIGTIDTHTPVNTTFVTGMPESGEIGFCSQSGAMVASVIDWARGAGVGFSRIVSLGNQVDINETQMIKALHEDNQTSVITAYIEGVSDGKAFMEIAQRAAKDKPVVALKGGRGESGARAVASHTGALAGSTEAYEAAFDRAGVQQASTMEEMFDWARALAWQPLPKGKNVAVLTNAGGPAILAVDALEKAGMELAELTTETKNYLKSRLPKAASVSNPVDVLAGSGPGTYAVALDALLTDETVDSVVVIQAPQDWFLPASLAEVVGEVAGVHDKPVITSIMGKASVEEALTILHKRKIPNVAFPERVASVLAAMVKRKEWFDVPQQTPERFTDLDENVVQQAVSKKDWKSLLKEYGIAFPPEQFAQTEEDAIEAAESIGYPVVLKLISESVSHKTEVNGVKLGLRNAEDVQSAWKDIKQAADSAGVDMEGVQVQKMLSGGQEVIMGLRRDSQFGPMVLFGTGGTDVELLQDVESAIAPLNRLQAEKLMDATRAGVKLKGWRNQPPADRETVIKYLMRLSQLGDDLSNIDELEMNPLYVLPEGQGAFAVDVRGTMTDDEKITI
ncbi:acetate--CoA ligase family protein [Fodinibius sp.]|uniref:acetate--CoA ligase family protein n=1 Tax=Fodinibius sp. TaxID=1872440 RepID=UPI002ACD99D3|nr:acetate--CoA ligase family protein [Fodinibius sp.]MDZ7657723.1 acetate--CoA ligase family protein [Fodinibius sp.]